MSILGDTDPKQFITDFFTSFNDAIRESDEAPAAIVDRFHTPDVVEIADGNRIDREKLIAHTRPVRKNAFRGRVEVHEALTDGDTLAARYTLHVTSPKRRDLTIEVSFFGQFAPDGRMRRAHLLTRTVPTDDAPDAPPRP